MIQNLVARRRRWSKSLGSGCNHSKRLSAVVAFGDTCDLFQEKRNLVQTKFDTQSTNLNSFAAEARDIATIQTSKHSFLLGAMTPEIYSNSNQPCSSPGVDGLSDLLLGSPGSGIVGDSDVGRVSNANGPWNRTEIAVSRTGEFNGEDIEDFLRGLGYASPYGVLNSYEAHILPGTNHSIAECDLTDLQSENGSESSIGLAMSGRRFFNFRGEAYRIVGFDIQV